MLGSKAKHTLLFIWLGCLVGLPLLFICPTVGLADNGDQENEEERPRNLIVRRWAYRRLTKIHEAIHAKKPDKALEILGEMKERRRLTDHERALMWQSYGYVFSGMQKYKEAIEAFSNSLALDAMAKSAMREMRFYLGQLYLSVGDNRKGIDTLKQWLKETKNPSPRSLLLLSQAYYRSKKPEIALQWAKKALAKRKDPPTESQLNYLYALHRILKHNDEAIKVLKKLCTCCVRRSYFIQLASLYYEQKKSDLALAVLEIGRAHGVLTHENELMSMAQLLIEQGIPWRAARLAQDVLKKGGAASGEERILSTAGNAWLGARNPARAAIFLDKAAKRRDNALGYLRVAKIYYDNQNYGSAIEASLAAISRRSIGERRAAALMLLGQSYLGARQYRKAVQSFKKAGKTDPSLRRSVRAWISTTRLHQRRREELAAISSTQ